MYFEDNIFDDVFSVATKIKDGNAIPITNRAYANDLRTSKSDRLD